MNLKPKKWLDAVHLAYEVCKEAEANDPVKHCQVYRTVGCTHVDGFHCDMKTCNIEVTVKVTPKSKVLI